MIILRIRTLAQSRLSDGIYIKICKKYVTQTSWKIIKKVKPVLSWNLRKMLRLTKYIFVIRCTGEKKGLHI
jgi:hypothetical protein